MKPGRELDVLIAEKVMGLEVIKNKSGSKFGGYYYTIGKPDWYDEYGEMKLFNPLPDYSEDISVAWQVVEKLSKTHWMTLDYPPYYGWICNFRAGDGSGNDFQAEAGTAPHAICLAALRAMGIEA